MPFIVFVCVCVFLVCFYVDPNPVFTGCMVDHVPCVQDDEEEEDFDPEADDDDEDDLGEGEEEEGEDGEGDEGDEDGEEENGKVFFLGLVLIASEGSVYF